MIYSSVTEKNSKHCKKIKINHLIVLCEVREDYKSFCNDLEELIKSKNNKDLVMKVYKAIQGKLSIIPKKYKKFIEKHKHTIKIMNKYYCLSNLIIFSYDRKGKREENLSEDYFYQYIMEHKEDIETIKAIALKIKNLGFNEINFGEKLDFTEVEYMLDAYFGDVVFLENMEANPTYLDDPNDSIKYRTNGSCYRMILKSDLVHGKKVLREYGKNIELNSLIFDPNKLPNEITTESTIGLIRKLAEKKKEEYEDIHNSVDLSISTSDLADYFERLKKLSERIDKIKDNKELVDLLRQMQNILTKLQLFGINFENQIINSHLDITEETMKREKEKYLNRRYLSSIHID